MVATFQAAPEFVEYTGYNIMEHVRKDKPFALFMLCECASELKWPIAELRAHPDWPKLSDKFVFGFIRLAASDQFQLWDNFAIARGGPSLGLDNIPAGQNLEKYLFRPHGAFFARALDCCLRCHHRVPLTPTTLAFSPPGRCTQLRD